MNSESDSLKKKNNQNVKRFWKSADEAMKSKYQEISISLDTFCALKNLRFYFKLNPSQDSFDDARHKILPRDHAAFFDLKVLESEG